MTPAIAIENLGKRYDIGHKRANGDGMRHALERAVRNPLAWMKTGMRRGPKSEDFWALRGVSLQIEPGEVVGIIGRNGAGKSTMLKLLSRITVPTEGRICIDGRVGSLLEVGTGFHQELTGRENIFLNGAILGMSRAEVRRKFDEIVAFGEVEEFLDTPVKRYSSGMYVRLAFAVAAHLEPEILIVDEVLAVGDGAFQKKCTLFWKKQRKLSEIHLALIHFCFRKVCIDSQVCLELWRDAVGNVTAACTSKIWLDNIPRWVQPWRGLAEFPNDIRLHRNGVTLRHPADSF